MPAATRLILVLAAPATLAALAMWALGQDFGGPLSGQATDPGTGPPLLLLAAAYGPLGRADPRPAMITNRRVSLR